MKYSKIKRKNEKGGISVLVLFTILIIMVILMGAFVSVTTLRKSQLNSDIQIQEIYGKDVEEVDDVYNNLIKDNFYTISYNANTEDTVTNMPESKRVSKSENITIDENIPECENYIFLGWGKNIDDTTAEYQPGDLYENKEDLQLYAIWTTKLEYIQTTGTQYIDTGIKFNSDMKIEVKLYVPTTITTAYSSFGVRTMINNTAIKGLYECGKQIIVADDSGYESIGTTTGDIVYTFTGNSLSYNETSVTSTKTCTNVDYNMYLCALNSDGEAIAICSGVKLYYSKIWDSNNELIQELIPCLDKSNVPCVYDNISKTFIYNSGTDTFAY